MTLNRIAPPKPQPAPEPPSEYVWNLDEVSRRQQQRAQSEQMRRAPVPMYNCDICGNSTPQVQQHVCTGLSKRQLARIAKWKRERAAQIARDTAPIRCPDCGTMTPPGRFHHCTGPVDHAYENAQKANLAGMVRMLERAGLKVSKKD